MMSNDDKSSEYHVLASQVLMSVTFPFVVGSISAILSRRSNINSIRVLEHDRFVIDRKVKFILGANALVFVASSYSCYNFMNRQLLNTYKRLGIN
jgi:hypothetical protein